MATDPTPNAAKPVELRELLVAVALRHVRLVPETRYGAEIVERVKADAREIAFEKAAKK